MIFAEEVPSIRANAAGEIFTASKSARYGPESHADREKGPGTAGFKRLSALMPSSRGWLGCILTRKRFSLAFA